MPQKKKIITALNNDDDSNPEIKVEIKDYKFNPERILIKKGDAVRWLNNDTTLHSISAPGKFESNTLAKGDSFTHVFNDIGIYDYSCGIYPNMTGKVVVE